MSVPIPYLIWAVMQAEAEAFESFAEHDWAHDPGPRSQNRWRNVKTGKIVYSATNPGGAASTPQADTAKNAALGGQKPEIPPNVPQAQENKTVAAEKRALVPRKTPEERQQLYETARAKVKDVLAGERTPEAAHELIGALSELTVKQLHDIKKEYGLKASGPRKEELKRKIAARMAGATTPSDQIKRTPAPKPEPWKGTSEPEIGQVYNAPTNDLQVDPERFQFKMNTNKEGVTQELKSVGKWNPDFAGVLAVWKDQKDGKTYVVNGHHRRELAGRLGIENLAVRYLDAKTPEEARSKGALINMAGGRGTAMDAAKYMRDAKATPEDLKTAGVSLKGKLIEDAIPLTKLNDRIFDRVVRGTFDPEKAQAIGKHLDNPDLQNKLVSLLDKREEDGKDLSTKTVEEMAREMATTPTHTVHETGGLFGDIESEESLFVERNELKSHIRQALAKDVRDFQAVASQRRAGRVAEAGNVLNVEKNKQIAQESDQTKNVFDTLVNRKGAVSDAVNEAAKAYADAKGKKAKDAAKSAAVESVRAAIKAESESTTVGGAKPAEGGANPKQPGGAESVSGVGAAGSAPGAATPNANAPDGGRGDAGPHGVKDDRSSADRIADVYDYGSTAKTRENADKWNARFEGESSPELQSKVVDAVRKNLKDGETTLPEVFKAMSADGVSKPDMMKAVNALAKSGQLKITPDTGSVHNWGQKGGDADLAFVDHAGAPMDIVSLGKEKPSAKATSPEKEDKSPGFPEGPHHPDPKQIKQMPGLNDEERAIETKAREYAVANYDKLREQYLNKPGNALKDENGNIKSVVLNTDEWRDLFHGYKGTNAQAVHTPSSWANKKLMAEMMQAQRGKGNNTYAMFGGGGGSGKGTAIKDFFKEEEYPIRNDTVADDAKEISEKFKEARELGYKPEYIFVDRKPMNAWEGVVGRAVHGHKKSGMGRTVPLDIAWQANHKARRAAIEVLKKDLDIPPSVIDNTTGEAGKRRLITDRAEAIAHLEKQDAENTASDKEDFQKAIEHVRDLHAKGEMPDEMAKALLGKHFKGVKNEPGSGISGRESVSGEHSKGTQSETAKDDRRSQHGRLGGVGGEGEPAQSGAAGGQEGIRGEAKTAGQTPAESAGGGKVDLKSVLKEADRPGFEPSRINEIESSLSSLTPAEVKQHAKDIGIHLARESKKEAIQMIRQRIESRWENTLNTSFHGSKPPEPKPGSEADYVSQAMANLKKTSRTAGGVVDTSASKGKADKMANVSGAEAAEHANRNFEKVIKDVHASRNNEFKSPRQVSDFVDQVNKDVNKGIVKEGVLDRTDDSTKFPYTAAADLPLAKKQFSEEFAKRLNDPNADPVETAAWVEWRANLTDHFWADGVGKTAKALAALPLMKAGLPLPQYRDNKEFFAHSQRKAYDPKNGGDSYLDASWDKFHNYFRTLMPKRDTTHEHVQEAKRKLAGGNIAVKGSGTSEPIKSDLSGDTIRRHVVLPNGARVHPNELHRAREGEGGKAELGPEKISVKDPMNRGEDTHGSFAKAVHAVGAYPIRHNDRVTIQGPHGYSATKTRKEWRDVAAKLKDKPESMAQWMDRENPEATSEAAKNAPASGGVASEKESKSFFHGGAPEQGKLFDYKTPAHK